MDIIVEAGNAVAPFFGNFLEIVSGMLQAGINLLSEILVEIGDSRTMLFEQLGAWSSSLDNLMWQAQIKGFDYVVGKLYSYFGEYLRPIFGNACRGIDAYPHKYINWFVYNGLWIVLSSSFFKGKGLWLFAFMGSSLGYLSISSLPSDYIVYIACLVFVCFLSSIDTGVGTHTGGYTSYNTSSYSNYDTGSTVYNDNYNTGGINYGTNFNDPFCYHNIYMQDLKKRQEEQRRMQEEQRRMQEEQQRRQQEEEMRRQQQQREEMERWAREQQARNGQNM